MDTNARVNALQQYMNLYRQNAGRNGGYSTPWDTSGFQPTRFNNDQDALNFAQQQVGQEQPDFFGSQAPAYTAPRSVQSMASDAGFPLAPQDRPQMQQRPEVTRAGMAANFLRTLFSR